MASGPYHFDPKLVRLRKARARKNFSKHSFLSDMVAAQIGDRLLDIKIDMPRILISGAGRLSEKQVKTFYKNSGAGGLCRLDTVSGDIIGDEEYFPFGKDSLDAIISHLSLHNINDLPGALIQINYALKPNGAFLGAMFGGESLYELREALMATEMELKGGVSPRISPFADKQQMGALLQRAGFALPVVDSDIIKVSYKDVFTLMRDIKGMGEGNMLSARNREYPGRAFFTKADEKYRDLFCDENGQLVASFEIIYLIGWAPHETQQKPLRPGSAKKSLAQALGTKEHGTGVRVKQ